MSDSALLSIHFNSYVLRSLARFYSSPAIFLLPFFYPLPPWQHCLYNHVSSGFSQASHELRAADKVIMALDGLALRDLYSVSKKILSTLVPFLSVPLTTFIWKLLDTETVEYHIDAIRLLALDMKLLSIKQYLDYCFIWWCFHLMLHHRSASGTNTIHIDWWSSVDWCIELSS